MLGLAGFYGEYCMKNGKIFLVLVASTLAIIFLYIWHHNTVIGYLYHKQRAEKQCDDLNKEKERLFNALLTTQNPHEIKRRAQALGMRPTPLAQIRKMGDNNHGPY